MDEKEIFIDMIMDLLVIIDFDRMSEDVRKEKKIKDELFTKSWHRLNDYYDKASSLVEAQHRSESIDIILKEIEELGADAVKEKYGII